MRFYETKDPNIADKVKEYRDTLYGKISDTKYIYTKS